VATRSPEPIGPRIDIHLGLEGVDIRQQRPAIARALVGLPVEAALARIPTLLPICGTAQAVAAARAVEAARGEEESREQFSLRENSLWREQALAAAWRLSVDWPDLLGEARRMELLKRVYRAAGDSECCAALGQMIEGLDPIDDIDGLQGWVRDSDNLAARVIRLAQGSGPIDSAEPIPAPSRDSAALRAIASEALAWEPFDPLDPAGSPQEVGPLAMGRDPLARELKTSVGSTVVSRLLGQLLDARVISGAGKSARDPGHTPAGAWTVPAGGGVGCAVTARGPVFHRVVLTGDTVADWRVLAPTDWHFSPRGPVASRLTAMAGQTRERVAILVTSYDPCAPWALHSATGGD